MKRRTPNPYPPSRNQRLGASRLALAVAAALAGASAVAGEGGRHVTAMHARALPGGEVTVQLETRAAPWHGSLVARAASTLPVTSCADDGSPGTLRSAVAAAADGDTIDLAGLTCDRIVLTLGKIESSWAVNDLTIQGPGRDALTIDGAGADGIFVHGGTGRLELRDLSVANGRVVDEWGGCVCAPGASIRLSGVRVSSCVAHQVSGVRGAVQGGAVFAFGDITLDDSEVLDSTASSEVPGAIPDGSGEGVVIQPVLGGGIATVTGNVALNRSRVSGNRAIALAAGGIGDVKGGGIFTRSGDVTIVDSVLAGNRVVSGFDDEGGYHSFVAGGALLTKGKLTIVGSTIEGNAVESAEPLAFDRGGGIAATGSLTLIEGTTIADNQASGDGGGLHHQGASLRIVNSTISGNVAARGAGGLYDVNPSSLDHVTIAFNHSGTQAGGAVLLRGGRVLNSIISRNTADGVMPADLASGDAGISGGRNLIGDTGRSPLPLDTLRADPRLLPLADNGGPTKTHALDRTSPAIDGGAHAKNLPLDQRGLPRSSGSAPDIGAFEVQQVGIAPLGNGASGRDARAKPGSR
jgi:hypothetical protein